jgi:hypothetical protein
VAAEEATQWCCRMIDAAKGRRRAEEVVEELWRGHAGRRVREEGSRKVGETVSNAESAIEDQAAWSIQDKEQASRAGIDLIAVSNRGSVDGARHRISIRWRAVVAIMAKGSRRTEGRGCAY